MKLYWKFLEYIVENVSALGPTAWTLILLFSIMIGSTLFCVFRWLFSSRYKAQRDLINLKDRTTREFKTMFTSIKKEKERLEEVHRTQLSQKMQVLSEAQAGMKMDQEQLEKWVVGLCSSVAGLRGAVIRLDTILSAFDMLARLYDLFIRFAMDNIVSDVDGTELIDSFLERLDVIEKKLAKAREFLPSLTPPLSASDFFGPVQLPKAFINFPVEEVMDEMEAALADLNRSCEAYLNKRDR